MPEKAGVKLGNVPGAVGVKVVAAREGVLALPAVEQPDRATVNRHANPITAAELRFISLPPRQLPDKGFDNN